MNDLISRQALCQYALNQKDKSVTPNDIMRFPSAQPELSKEQVRCEQCIHWNDKIPVAEDTGECRMLDSYTLADWFCADGERKEPHD